MEHYVIHMTAGELREMLRAAVRETLSERPQENVFSAPQTAAPEADELLDTAAACRLLKISRNTLFAWVKNDLVTSRLLGGKRFYRRNELLQLVSGKKGRGKR